jgi:hypothetical protein
MSQSYDGVPPAKIVVFNIMGQQIIRGKDCTSLSLVGIPSDIYIVKVNKKR